MPPLPVVSGRRLVSFMQSYGYLVVRRRGSHIRLKLHNQRGEWVETVPDHREVARGTLRSVLGRMSMATGEDIGRLVQHLAEA